MNARLQIGGRRKMELPTSSNFSAEQNRWIVYCVIRMTTLVKYLLSGDCGQLEFLRTWENRKKQKKSIYTHMQAYCIPYVELLKVSNFGPSTILWVNKIEGGVRIDVDEWCRCLLTMANYTMKNTFKRVQNQIPKLVI